MQQLPAPRRIVHGCVLARTPYSVLPRVCEFLPALDDFGWIQVVVGSR